MRKPGVGTAASFSAARSRASRDKPEVYPALSGVSPHPGNLLKVGRGLPAGCAMQGKPYRAVCSENDAALLVQADVPQSGCAPSADLS